MSAIPQTPDVGALYGRHRERVFAFCLGRLRRREDAEDAAQATFLYALRALDRGIVPRHEAAWLCKIADNVCRTRIRSLQRRGRVEALADVSELQDAREPGEPEAYELDQLLDALGTMPENQRRALLLREWQGLSYDEIAEMLEISHSAVETLIFRARRGLARRLEGVQQRVRSLLDLGSILAVGRSLLSSAGAKGAAAAVAIGAASVVGGPPLVHEIGRAISPPHRSQPATPSTPAHSGALVVRDWQQTERAEREAGNGTARVRSAPARERAQREGAPVSTPSAGPDQTEAPNASPPSESMPGASSDTPTQVTVPSAPAVVDQVTSTADDVIDDLPVPVPTVPTPPVEPPDVGVTVPAPPPVTVPTPTVPDPTDLLP